MENTYIVITADHGEEFNEHGYIGHTTELYKELLHVPLIIIGGRQFEQIKIDKTVSMVDLAPTVLDLAGLNLNKKAENIVGKSLLPLVYNKDSKFSPSDAISEVSHCKGDLQIKPENRKISITTGEWKFIMDYKEDTKELFNLLDDPNERVNVVQNNLEIAAYFADKIQNHVTYNISNETKEIDYTDEVRRRLEGLGYL